MVEERRSEGAQRRREDAPGAVDPGDAVPPGVGAGGGGVYEAGDRRGAGRDPGDAIPPGVAPLEPPEPTDEDRRVLEKFRDLPRRG